MIRFDLEVRRGNFDVRAAMESDARVAGLFGPSGAGKTTILMTLAGLVNPVRGRIEVAGRVLYDSSTNVWVPPDKRRVGVVFQEDRLFPHLTVRDNLVFSRPAPTAVGSGFDEIVHLLDLEPLLPRYPRQLSGGQARLVAVGRSLLYRPQLLLLDEPLTGLDPDLRRRVLAYLLRLKESVQVNMLFVSHVFADFLALVDEAGLVSEGHLHTQGAPDELMVQALGLAEAGRVETILVGEVTGTNGPEATVTCAGADFVLRLDGATRGDTAYVTVAAEDVLIGVGGPPVTSARNVLTGRVREIQRSGSQILVGVDAGPRIWAQVTEDSITRLALEPEKDVYLLVKAAALRGVFLSASAAVQS